MTDTSNHVGLTDSCKDTKTDFCLCSTAQKQGHLRVFLHLVGTEEGDGGGVGRLGVGGGGG